MSGGVYVIKMIQEQKFYIGATVNFSNRFKSHLSSLRNNKKYNPYLQASYNENGLYNLEFSTLEECNDEVLDERENYWMNKYKNDYGENCLVNLQSGGKRGYKIGEEVLKKMSEAKKGIPKSEEHKQKLSEAKKGENHPLYGKTGKLSPNYGSHRSAETKQKMSAARKGMFVGSKSPMYGKKLSEETKQKISEAKRLYWQNKKIGI